jgi:CheY-like chemotaxis protein
MPDRTILVVDDDPILRQVLCSAIDWIGFESIEAEDGDQALQTYLQKRPAMVITDIYMPKMSGIHLLRMIRRYEPDAKVVLITGGTNYWQLAQDSESRPDGYLEKPFNITDLMELVRKLVLIRTPAKEPVPAEK